MKTFIINLLQRFAPLRLAFFAARMSRAAAHFVSAFRRVRSIAFDMDGVFVEFDETFVKEHNKRLPELHMELDDLRHHKLEDSVIDKYGLARVAEVLGERRVAEQYDPNKPVNDEEKLIRRALRSEALSIINDPGFFKRLKPIPENIEQVRRIIDLTIEHRAWCSKSNTDEVGPCGTCWRDVGEQKYRVSILTALPNKNSAGFQEKTKWLKTNLGRRYFNKLHQRIYVAGQHVEKGDVYWDVIFEDNTRLTGTLSANSGLHMIVETAHNKHFKPGFFQKFLPRGSDWIKEAGL